MESADEEQHVSHSQGLKQKCRDLYNKSKFPITLEPVVFFFTLSVGLNEVDILPQILKYIVSKNKYPLISRLLDLT